MSGPTVLIMAAGEGTRMRSSVPKMLHPVCGRPMVAWPVLAAREAGAERVCVIVSPERNLVDALPEGTETAVQTQSDGTGGAIRAALGVIDGADTVIVLNGDHPLVTADHLREVVQVHRDAGAAATMVTVDRPDPESLGRVVRDASGDFERIVETKYPEGIAPEILAIHEVNTNTFAFDTAALTDAINRITNDNAAGEYYIGDALNLMRAEGKRVIAHKVGDVSVNIGVNNRAELARVATVARHRILERHMLAGVTVTDPAATWIDADVEIEPDAVIEPGTTLRGQTRVGRASIVGPHTTVIDSQIGPEVTAPHSYITQSEIADGCSIGPFAYLRPGTVVGPGSKVGTFVELKNTRIGSGTKVPHLSYLGDADVGDETNVGAATITANYDGFRKHRTNIGHRVHTSVDTTLVAPVSIGDGAYTGANSAITEDVPPGALGIARPKQENIEGYADRKAREETEEGDAEDS
ncbi:MAG: UDP-N-acetylglucosamine diphosphorylase/glucosamine-1-phosphate N-acetyltransferase [Actinobacteria bacterium]|nr:MAG: UDP-N-acetylglucosamine diphosphorylase/glucosamine-1-phosphate N-acetyltransferase [Actinomycetota bacterium]